MRTLADLVRGNQRLPDGSVATSATWPRPAKPKAKLYVTGERAITLPTDIAGLQPVDGPGDGVSPMTAEDSRSARALLLYAPSIVIPLQRPSNEDLSALGMDSDRFRRENPRAVVTAVAVESRDGTVIYGVSRIIAIENGLRMGSTLVLANSDAWTGSLDEAESLIVSKCQPLAESFEIAPDPGQNAWPTVAALLGGSDQPGELPEGWKHRLKFAAALRRVNLDIRPSPDSSRPRILHELRTQPPDALLVWAEWVPVPELYLAPFRSARPNGYAHVLGVQARGAMTFDDHLAELQMHLREISPIRSDDSPDELTRVSRWDDAAPAIRALEGKHLALTARAKRMLIGNPYPKPHRMLLHVEKLATIAREYHESAGKLGARLTDYAINYHGIEIALFDSTLTAPEFEFDGLKFQAIPHVKVDDAKSPDQVGRIYFAIDSTKFRFIIDHIGLHDYS